MLQEYPARLVALEGYIDEPNNQQRDAYSLVLFS
jgi:hypothetical protein